MLISLIDIFLIASGIAGWLVLIPLWLWRRRHDKAHALPHLPTIEELDARAAVAVAKAAEAHKQARDRLVADKVINPAGPARTDRLLKGGVPDC